MSQTETPSGTSSPTEEATYLLAGQDAELERLLLQSRVWEPSGQQLLARLGSGAGARVVDIGCGALGWLRILSDWVGPTGQVVGTDIDPDLLDVARSVLDADGVTNVQLDIDDLFTTTLEPGSFDLVHARYLIAPLDRGREQVAIYRSLVRPGGWLVCEEWDAGSWHYNPPAPATEQLIALIYDVFTALGGEAGRQLPQLMRDNDIDDVEIDAHLVALPPGHPYLRLPLQFSVSLEPRLLQLVSANDLADLRQEVEQELADPARWGTTFTLIQCWAKTDMQEPAR